MILVAAGHPLWSSTPRALEIGGPRAFGYDMDFVPFAKYNAPRSVIDEFGPEKKD